MPPKEAQYGVLVIPAARLLELVWNHGQQTAEIYAVQHIVSLILSMRSKSTLLSTARAFSLSPAANSNMRPYGRRPEVAQRSQIII
jgi:hypothetical protein